MVKLQDFEHEILLIPLHRKGSLLKCYFDKLLFQENQLYVHSSLVQGVSSSEHRAMTHVLHHLCVLNQEGSQ